MISLFTYIFALHVLPSFSQLEPIHYEIAVKIISMTRDFLPRTFTSDTCIKLYCRSPTKEVKLFVRNKNQVRDITFDNGIQLTRNGMGRQLLLNLSPTTRQNETYNLCIKYGGMFDSRNGYTWIYPNKDKNQYILVADSEKQLLFPSFDGPNMRATFKITMETYNNFNYFHAIYKHGEFLSYIISTHDQVDKEKEVTYELTKTFPASQIPFLLTNMELYTSRHKYSLSNEWQAVFKSSYPDIGQELETFHRDIKIDASIFMENCLPEVQFIVVPSKEKFVAKWNLISISKADISDPDLRRRKYNIYIGFTQMIFGGLISPSSSKLDHWIFSAFAEFLAVVHIQGAHPRYMWARVSDNVFENMVGGVDKLQFNSNSADELHSMEKGFLLLKTIYNYLGYEKFMKKTKEIISGFQYKSASSKDLIGKFGQVQMTRRQNTLECLVATVTCTRSDETLTTVSWSDIVDRYTSQQSYPLVTVTSEANSFVVKQEFFGTFEDPNGQNFTKHGGCWYVPLPYAISDKENKIKRYGDWKYWLDCRSKSTDIPFNGTQNVVIVLNYKCAGMYRVKYDDTLWTNLVSFIQNFRTGVHPHSRACIVHDALSLAWVGYSNYTYAFKLLTSLKYEEESMVWEAFFLGASDLNEILLFSEELYPLFQGFVNEIINPTFTKKYHNYFDILNKDSVIVMDDTDVLFYKWACIVAKNRNCTNQAIEKFNQWKSGVEITDKWNSRVKQMLNTVLCTVLSEKSDDDALSSDRLEFFVKSFFSDDLKNKNYEEEYINVLRCMNNEATVNGFLKNLSSSSMKIERKEQSFLSLAAGKDSYLPALQFFIRTYANEEDLYKYILPKTTDKACRIFGLRMNETFLQEVKGRFPTFETNYKELELKKLWLEINNSTIKSALTSYKAIGRKNGHL